MPIPIILGAIAAVAALGGVASGTKGVIDTKEANKVQNKAEAILQFEQEKIQKTKDSTVEAIKKLGELKLKASSQSLGTFVDVFSKIKDVELGESAGLEELAKLNVSKENLKEMKNVSLHATDVLSGGIAGVGAGALLGWGTYGGVMALGSMVLGGIIAGPALLIAGGIFGAKARTKLNNAYSNLAEAKKIAAEIELAESELQIVIKNAMQVRHILHTLNRLLVEGNARMKIIAKVKTNWKEYTVEEKNIVAAAVKSAQLVKAVIDTPLLSEDGLLTKEIRDLQNDQEVNKALSTSPIWSKTK